MRRVTQGPAHSPASLCDRATIGAVTTPSAPTRPLGPSGRTAVLVLVAAVLIAMLALPVRSWFLQRAQIAAAQEQLTATQERITQLQLQRQQWSDKAYIEEQARERLGYVYPGEVGIVVLKPGDTSRSGTQPRTWYEGLWQTVDSASGRGVTAVGDPVQVRPSAPR